MGVLITLGEGQCDYFVMFRRIIIFVTSSRPLVFTIVSIV